MKGSAKTLAWASASAIGLMMGIAQAAGVQPATAAPASAQAIDPVAVVDAFDAAGDDIEAALALLTDDVVIELLPPPPNTPGIWKGKEGAREFFKWKNSGGQRRMRAGDAVVVSDGAGFRVTGNVGVASDPFTRLGVGTVGHTFEAVVVDGKLKSYRGQITPEEAKRVAEARLAAERAQAAQPPAGMPRTGAPLILPLLTVIGMAILTAGVALRRRTT